MKALPKQNRWKSVLWLIVFFFLGLFIAKKINFTGTPQLAAKAAVNLSTTKNNLKPGEQFKVTMTLDSGNQEVAAADFVVLFDPKSVQVLGVTTGKYFSNYPINRTGENYIKISGVAGYNGKSLKLPKGRETVGEITFKALDKGTATISVDQKKTIIATAGKNILNKNKAGKLDVNIL